MATSPPAKVAWFNCFAGIAGDMALASLLDAGAPLAAVQEILERLPLKGWSLTAHSVLRAGITATQVQIVVDDDDTARPYPVVLELLESAGLPERIERRARAAFDALARVEGHLHGEAPERVHFHEVGGHDSVIDVVGTMAALECLEIDQVEASPVAVGLGTIASAHGLLPNPAPAVLGLLAGAPLVGRDIGVELTTPTGAAILTATACHFGALPAMTLEATGYGAGGREIDGLPNCTQVVIGRYAPHGARDRSVEAGQPLELIEANLDDATGEQIADALGALLAAGAADTWVTPVLMKKGRPGHVVSVLADPALAPDLRALLMRATGSFGARTTSLNRFASQRHFDKVEIAGRAIRIKVGEGRAKAEHDDAQVVARELDVPTQDIQRLAEGAFRTREDAAGTTPEGSGGLEQP